MHHRCDRREFVRWIGVGSTMLSMRPAAGVATSRTWESGQSATKATGLTSEALSPLDRMMVGFLERHGVPGASLAVSKNGRLVYARGFGLADTETGRAVEPDALFRIASVSKPVTAIAVIRLASEKSVALETPVFDVLSPGEWLIGSSDERLRHVTIRHLLQHRGGWDRDRSFDPIGRPNEAVRTLGKSLPASAEDILRYTLKLPLDFAPGERFAYSNVGYLLLGRLIERLSSENYESHVRTKLLVPSGIATMKLGRSWVGDLEPREVRYYDSQNRSRPAVSGPKLGVSVPLVYGGENFEGFEAHGGWIASAIDLVRFASAIDAAERPMLTESQRRSMIERPDGIAGHDPNGVPKPAYYGEGWNVRPIGKSGKANTWHSGLIAGTSALLVRRHDGMNWAVLFNTDRARTGEVLANLIDPLVHRAVDSVNQWPETIERPQPPNSRGAER